MSQRGGIILEFHSCDFFPERWFDLIVLLRCENTQLFDRLQERGYDQKKIDENIDCEIFGVLKEEVESSYAGERIIELQSNEVDDMQRNMDIVAERLKILVEQKKIQHSKTQ